ncbi:MAG: hypothetical protein J6Y08_05550 [Clostridiales bacterium]|nr:hypothetical protein [Clostridiales bacterium]
MRKLKTLAALTLVASLSLSLFGCGLIKKADKTPWQDEAKTKMADKLDEDNVGHIYLNGQEYDFPMKVSDLLDNGWEYEKDIFKDDKVPSYDWYKYQVDLKLKKATLTLEVYNDSDEEVLVKDCLVGSLTINSFSGPCMFSGEMFIDGTSGTEIPSGDGIYAFTAEGFEFDDTNTAGNVIRLSKDFHCADGKKCTAVFVLQDSKLHGVTYECSFTISAADYAAAAINSVIHNDPSYIYAFNAGSDAESYIATFRQYLAEDLVYYIGFDLPTLTEEQYAKLYQYLDIVFANASFTLDGQTAGAKETLIISYHAPDDFDTQVELALTAAAEKYDGELDANAAADPAFLDLFLDEFLAIAPDFTYNMPHNTTVEYTEEKDATFDSDLYLVVLKIIGLYDYDL